MSNTSLDKTTNWINANPTHTDIILWSLSADGHRIAKDIVNKLARYGNLSEPQINLLYRLKNQAAERAAEPQPTTPAPVGRTRVSGVVVSTKTTSGRFGVSTKMIVKLDDFNKVWCSVPPGFTGGKGDRIEFVATFKHADNDTHFAFGRVPKLVAVPVAPVALVAIAA